uniref:CpSecY n=1 Tax=Ananas comosus var. bracteatus TaxID=296719 RepID=A0A6V7QAV4_ANACO|nr:unnamed protein product [Ananas comosus var. bracteatus]
MTKVSYKTFYASARTTRPTLSEKKHKRRTLSSPFEASGFMRPPCSYPCDRLLPLLPPLRPRPLLLLFPELPFPSRTGRTGSPGPVHPPPRFGYNAATKGSIGELSFESPPPMEAIVEAALSRPSAPTSTLWVLTRRSLSVLCVIEKCHRLRSQTFESTSSSRKEKSSVSRGAAAAIEDSSIDIGDFFKGPLPGKFLKLLGYLALSRLGVYIPLGGVNRKLLLARDLLLGIVPFINAQIVFQLLAQVYPKLQDLQKRREGRKEEGSSIYEIRFVYLDQILRSFLQGYWASSLPSSLCVSRGKLHRTCDDCLIIFLLVLGIVYVQEAERKIPLNYASRYSSRSGGLQRSAYLPFKLWVMPIIFSTSSLALPGTLARFTGLSALKNAAVALNPGGALYLPTNILLIAFFNYYYTFLQLDPDDVSEQLKRQGASIPLVRPGKSTAAFLKTVLSRISVLGSAFLAVLAAGPAVIEQTTHLTAFRGFAGTSVLILVGCATDTARKVQAEIISQKYKNIEFYDINRYGPP